jgi:hypothetical protein
LRAKGGKKSDRTAAGAHWAGMFTAPEPISNSRMRALNAALTHALEQIKSELAARRLLHELKANPNWPSQPRVPAGQADGGQWTSGGGGGKPLGGAPKQGGPRPPAPRPGIGHNNPPRPGDPPPERLHLDWRNMSNQDYAEALGALLRQRNADARIGALQQAIGTLDPNYNFAPIVTRPGSRHTYETHLRRQLNILRIQLHGPLGMEREQWAQFRRDVTSALRRSRDPNAEAFLRGSAVSGVSFRRGVLDFSGPRDFDAAITSGRLLEAARRRGVRLRGGGTRTGPLRARTMATIGVRGLADRINGKRVTYDIFSSETAMRVRPGAAIPLSE